MFVSLKDHRTDHRQTQTRSSMLHAHKEEVAVLATPEPSEWKRDHEAAERLRNYDAHDQANQEG